MHHLFWYCISRIVVFNHLIINGNILHVGQKYPLLLNLRAALSYPESFRCLYYARPFKTL